MSNGLITVGAYVIANPIEVGTSDVDNLQKNINSLTPATFIFPFLAHALVTLAGAAIDARLIVSHPMSFSLIIVVFFLTGGAIGGGPLWFILLNLILACIPMRIIGSHLARRKLTPF
ncbi:hypothetical protein N9B39_01745 [bacterium]|nr:hypothetical protein [bacterium]